MKNLKFGILAFGVLGLVACFLPFIPLGKASMSFFDARKLDSGPIYLTMGGFALATAMGGMGLKRLLKWQAGLAAAGFALVIYKLNSFNSRVGIVELFKDGALGAKLMIIAAIAGVVISILAVVKGAED